MPIVGKWVLEEAIHCCTAVGCILQNNEAVDANNEEGKYRVEMNKMEGHVAPFVSQKFTFLGQLKRPIGYKKCKLKYSASKVAATIGYLRL